MAEDVDSISDTNPANLSNAAVTPVENPETIIQPTAIPSQPDTSLDSSTIKAQPPTITTPPTNIPDAADPDLNSSLHAGEEK